MILLLLEPILVLSPTIIQGVPVSFRLSAGYLLLDVHASEMQVGQFGPDFGEFQLPGRDFVAEGAAELFKSSRLLLLCLGAPRF